VIMLKIIPWGSVKIKMIRRDDDYGNGVVIMILHCGY
jgi:hypothetical protein